MNNRFPDISCLSRPKFLILKNRLFLGFDTLNVLIITIFLDRQDN